MSPKVTVVYRDPFQVTLDIVSGKLPGVDLSGLLQKYPQQMMDLVAAGVKNGGFTASTVEKTVGSIFDDAGPEGGVLGNVNLLSLLSFFTEKYSLQPLGALSETSNVDHQEDVPVRTKRKYTRRKAKTADAPKPPKKKSTGTVSEQVRVFLGTDANAKRLLKKAGGLNKLAKQIREEQGIDVKDANFYQIFTHKFPKLVVKRKSRKK